MKFETVNPYLIGLTFEDCNLELASFYGMELHRQLFKDCNLSKADFTDSHLSQCKFDKCNLDNTLFQNTNLERANFSTAYNYQIDPEQNLIRGAIFSTEGLQGLLKKYQLKVL